MNCLQGALKTNFNYKLNYLQNILPYIIVECKIHYVSLKIKKEKNTKCKTGLPQVFFFLSLVGVRFSRRTIDSSLLLYARVFPAAFTSYALVCGFSLALWGAEPSPSLGHTPPRCSAQLWVFLPHCGFSLPCSGLFSLLAWVFSTLSGCIR